MNDSGYKIRDPYGIHFLTFTAVGWIDVFTRKETKQILIDSFKYCIENKGLVLYAYVIMTNHVHIIARAEKSTSGLSDIIRDFKKFTSKAIIKWVTEVIKRAEKNGCIWYFSTTPNIIQIIASFKYGCRTTDQKKLFFPDLRGKN